MYSCSICHSQVKVDHITVPKCCEWATILTQMSSSLSGVWGIAEVIPNNNLSEVTALLLQKVMCAIISAEVFTNKKSKVFAHDVIIEDEPTHRKFTYTLNVQELCLDSTESNKS